MYRYKYLEPHAESMAKFTLNPIKAIRARAPVVKVRRQRNGKRRTETLQLKDVDFRMTDGPKAKISFKDTRDGKIQTYSLSSWDIRDLNVAKQVSSVTPNLIDSLWKANNSAVKDFVKDNALDIVTKAFNANDYKNMVMFSKAYVTYVYASNSRVVRGTSNLLAVKLNTGAKGWLTIEGKFISQDSVFNLMEGLDGTVASGRYDFSFTEVWDSMSAQQRAEFTDLVKDVDWDEFWKVKYDQNDPLSSGWIQAVDTVVDALDRVING